MAGGGGGDVRQLDKTPTWAVASVCAVIVVISIVLEKLIHKIAKVHIYNQSCNILFCFCFYGFLIYIVVILYII